MPDIFNATTGEQIRFLSRSPDRLVFEDRILAGKLTPPPHLHPHQDERFTLLEGEFELYITGTWQTMTVGQSLLVKKNTTHTFRIPNGTHATLQVEFSPALDTETVFRTMAKAGQSGRINPRYVALIATQTKAGFHLAGLPPLVQRMVFGCLGFFARVSGIRLEQ